MATRLYCPATAVSTPISPTPAATWEDVSILQRVMTSTSKIADPMATVSFSDADATNKDVLYRQYISAPLTVGQTITGSSTFKGQIRALETDAGNNLFVTVAIYVHNGTSLTKSIVSIRRDTVEADATVLTNRTVSGPTQATDYTTAADDRLVIEVGLSGDPAAGKSHSGSLRFGDAAATDLTEDDLSVVDLNPWLELTDTLTFDAEPATFRQLVVTQAVNRSAVY